MGDDEKGGGEVKRKGGVEGIGAEMNEKVKMRGSERLKE